MIKLDALNSRMKDFYDIWLLSRQFNFSNKDLQKAIELTLHNRKRNTLILVHRKHLMDQWREKLSVFLGIEPKEIGQISGDKKQITGKLDVAVIQSLSRKGTQQTI